MSGWRFANRGIRLGVEAAGDPFFFDLDSRSLVGAGEGDDNTSLSSGCDGQSSERESSHACPMVAVIRDDAEWRCRAAIEMSWKMSCRDDDNYLAG